MNISKLSDFYSAKISEENHGALGWALGGLDRLTETHTEQNKNKSIGNLSDISDLNDKAAQVGGIFNIEPFCTI